MSQHASGLLETVASWSAAGAVFVGSVALLRRRLSRDRTEITKDTVEASFVERLLIERDNAQADARAAWQARQVDAETIARLLSEANSQAAEIARMSKEFASFQRKIGRIFPTAREFLDTGCVPLKDIT